MMRHCVLFLYFTILAPLAWGQDLSTDDQKKWNKEGLAYTDLANKAWYNQVYDSCLIYSQLAFEAYTKAEKWESANNELLGIAGVYYQIDDYEQTLAYNEKAAAHARKHLSANHGNYANILNFQALVLQIKGRYREANRKLEEAGKIFKANKATPSELANHLQSIAHNQRKSGDYDDAISNLLQALRYRQGIADEPPLNIAQIYIPLAHNHFLKKEYRAAIAYNRKAIELLRKLPAKQLNQEATLEAYTSLSENYRMLNRIDSARYFVQKALKIQQGEMKYLKEKSYLELGELALLNEQYTKGLQHFSQALEASKERYSKLQHHPKFSLCQERIAQTYLEMGQSKEALLAYQKALKALAPGFNSTDFDINPPVEQLLSPREGFAILRGKGKALLAQHQKGQQMNYLQGALATYQVLFSLIDHARNSFVAEESKLYLQANALGAFEEGIAIALQLYEKKQEQKYLELAFNFAEQNKAILMQEALLSNQALGVGGIPDSLLNKELQLKNDLAFYQKQILETKNRNPDNQQQIGLWEGELFRLKQQYNALQTTLETDFPLYYDLKKGHQFLALSDLQKQRLTPQDLLLEYFVGPQAIYLFAIHSNTTEVVTIKDRTAVIAGVERLRDLLRQAPQSNQFEAQAQEFNQLSHQLYQQLLEPVLSKYPDAVQLTIVPDAQVNYLPFEVLQTEPNDKADYRLGSKSYLLESHTIAYRYTAKLLNPKMKQSKRSKRFVGFAPSFSSNIASSRSCSNEELFALQCNNDEVNAIQELLGGNAFYGIEATKQNFVEQMAQADILHLATHACVNLETAELSQIFFTGDYLTAVELKNLQLQAELAVLSACNTGSGKLQAGEGLMSLARSFTIAGVPSTLMSLWSVDDCATADIMTSFYQELRTGSDQPSAIRNAKLAFLQQANKGKAHPYYWAPFQMVGEARPIFTGSAQWPSLLLIGGAVLLLLLFGFLLRKKIKTAQ